MFSTSPQSAGGRKGLALPIWQRWSTWGESWENLKTNAIVYGQIPTHGDWNLPYFFSYVVWSHFYVDFRGDLASSRPGWRWWTGRRRETWRWARTRCWSRTASGWRTTCAAWQTTSAPSSRLAGLQFSFLICFIFFETISSSELKRSTRLVGPHKLKRMLLRCRSSVII